MYLKPSFCVLLALVSVTRGSTDLTGPCRTWLYPCGNGDWRCTSLEAYQRFQTSPVPLCPSIQPSTPPPLPAQHCRVLDGVCQFTNTTVNCTTWSSACEPQYHCGTVEERDNTDPPSCLSSSNPPPQPDRLCEPENDTCEWYNPCKSWLGHCQGSVHCGTLDEYYSFLFGPQPLCALPPPGWVQPTPPGQCIVQSGQCVWSNCTSWLDWCRTSWQCGTQYDEALYRSGVVPPCAPMDNYVDPPTPRECVYETDTQMCRYGQCPNGKEYTECGTACPLTCDNFRTSLICTEQCVAGCFCPEGTVELNSGCIEPSLCPDPCALVDCPHNHFCEVSSTGQPTCIATCENNNGGCHRDQECVPSSFVLCLDTPSIPCRQVGEEDSCTDINTRCLVQNKTKEGFCLDSCFLDNGGCGSDGVCYSKIDRDCDPRSTRESCPTHVDCLEVNDLSGARCPPGWEYSQCGSACESTCEGYLSGEDQMRVCIALCVEGCFCPPGLINYRDRCVDPRECHALVNDPPPINALPVKPDVVLLSLVSPALSPDEFKPLRGVFVRSSTDILQDVTSSSVQVKLHGFYTDTNGLRIVIEVSGRGVSIDKVSVLVSQLRQMSNALPLQIVSVDSVETQVIPLVQPLSVGAIVGIVIAVLVLLLAIVVVTASLLIFRAFRRKRKIRAEIDVSKDPSVSYAKLDDEIVAGSVPVSFEAEEEKEKVDLNITSQE